MKNTELNRAEEIVLGFARNAANAKDIETGAWHLRAAQRNAAKLGTTLEAIEEKAAAIEAAAKAPKVEAPAKVRCPHYKAIREFFKVARELGLDTSKESKDRWRGALGMLLGRPIESRSELTGAEWSFATNALRMGKLFI
jgi:hypothetical protein